MTWQDYEADLEPRIEDLHGRVHRGAYRPQPSRRTYIPKADGKLRPLAIAALEDKVVQGATVIALNAIYEGDFRGFSYGFRPGRGPHDALDALSTAIKIRKVNWILDADIQNFFGAVSQDWLVRFLEHRIDAVRNALTEDWSNGQTEGQINRLKTLKRAMYGRASTELLGARMLPIYQPVDHRV